jgi:HSP20 family protein
MSNLTRYSPLSDVARFDPLMDIDNLLDRFAATALRPSWPEWGYVEPKFKMDIADVGTEYFVKADIPGVKKDDIHVSIDGNLVTISAEIKHELETEEGKMLRSERSYGKTMRSFRLDDEVIEDKASAKYVDGVLELKLPKKSVTAHKELAIS